MCFIKVYEEIGGDPRFINRNMIMEIFVNEHNEMHENRRESVQTFLVMARTIEDMFYLICHTDDKNHALVLMAQYADAKK